MLNGVVLLSLLYRRVVSDYQLLFLLFQTCVSSMKPNPLYRFISDLLSILCVLVFLISHHLVFDMIWLR
jgi:hypothetical protein